ncbi:aminoglycoside phosphotransferase family protein [Robertmurraya yapensis]|uniref:Aminoglycoside phosphotransferase family protein n=2 Tax=Bacillaceae TaxID=186817 RepID=A0A431WKY4_9BACI|nr:aminoglycoside phosphotransferase family protein [Bacillus yapensis]RTR36268.1 aminoglycoside phosphotransferase family protein [Bacillus yapensis]TKT05771.1 aminoglycoside phosphotransferase family protein [Bacillus yapensis]
MNVGKPIAIGNTASLYLYENKIIKVFKDHLPPTEALNEAKKQEYAYSRGLPVPKIFEVTVLKSRPAIIMEYINGETLGDLLMNHIEEAKHYMDICVNEQQKLHVLVVESDSLEPMSEKLKRQIDDADVLDPKLKDALLKRLDTILFEPKLCHGDFHPFNVIMKDEKAYVLDWVDSTSGDIRADVYRTYLLFSQSSSELAEKYMNKYCKNTGLSREEIFQWAPIIAGARLAENVSSEDNNRLMEIVLKYL